MGYSYSNYRVRKAKSMVAWIASGSQRQGRVVRKTAKIVIAIFYPSCFIPPVFSARVAELVDAHDSGSCVRKDVEVRFLSRAPLKIALDLQGVSGLVGGLFAHNANATTRVYTKDHLATGVSSRFASKAFFEG